MARVVRIRISNCSKPSGATMVLYLDEESGLEFLTELLGILMREKYVEDLVGADYRAAARDAWRGERIWLFERDCFK